MKITHPESFTIQNSLPLANLTTTSPMSSTM